MSQGSGLTTGTARQVQGRKGRARGQPAYVAFACSERLRQEGADVEKPSYTAYTITPERTEKVSRSPTKALVTLTPSRAAPCSGTTHNDSIRAAEDKDVLSLNSIEEALAVSRLIYLTIKMSINRKAIATRFNDEK